MIVVVAIAILVMLATVEIMYRGSAYKMHADLMESLANRPPYRLPTQRVKRTELVTVKGKIR